MKNLNVGTNVHLVLKHKKEQKEVHKIHSYYPYKDSYAVMITSYKTGKTHGAYQPDEIVEVNSEIYPEYFLWKKKWKNI